jgi:ethanolamine ammonia-lyase large subunit
MGVPCADDVMLGYQSTSFHDAAAVRQLFGLRPAPEFASWLEERGIFEGGRLAARNDVVRGELLRAAERLALSGATA